MRFNSTYVIKSDLTRRNGRSSLGVVRAPKESNYDRTSTYPRLPASRKIYRLQQCDSATLADAYHFAGLDYDYSSGYTGTAHAQFRQYYNANGLWMSPDSYAGSYDFSNPQTFNRYSYVLNNPLSMTDKSGQDGCLALLAGGAETANPIGIGAGIAGCVLDILGLTNFLESLFGGPAFHGTLKPRPNAQPWDENHIQYGADVADALGIPDAGCEFGACGPGAMGITNGIGTSSSRSLLHSIIGQVELAALFFGINNASNDPFLKPNYYRVTCFGNPTGLSYSKRGCTYACGGEEEIGPFPEFPTGGIFHFTQKQLRPMCGSLSETFCPSELTVEGNYTPGTGWDTNPYISNCKQ